MWQRASQAKYVAGNVTLSAGVSTTINTGFKPTRIFVYKISASGGNQSNKSQSLIYDENISTTICFRNAKNDSGTAYMQALTIALGTDNSITHVSSTGFIVNASQMYAGSYYYVATA